MIIDDYDDQDQGDVVEDRRRKMPRSKIEVPLQPAVWEGLLFQVRLFLDNIDLIITVIIVFIIITTRS